MLENFEAEEPEEGYATELSCSKGETIYIHPNTRTHFAFQLKHVVDRIAETKNL